MVLGTEWSLGQSGPLDRVGTAKVLLPSGPRPGQVPVPGRGCSSLIPPAVCPRASIQAKHQVK